MIYDKPLGLVISGDTIADVFAETVYRIYTEGKIVTTEYGTLDKPKMARAVDAVMLEVRNPHKGWHHGDPFCSESRVKYYRDQFKLELIKQHREAHKDDPTAEFEYTYIERLREREVDQIAYINSQLKKERFDTKRLIASTWIPEKDCDVTNKSPPCFQYMSVYPTRDYKLLVHVHYRSQDMWKAFEANLNALIEELVKNQIEDDQPFMISKFVDFIDNAHIYEDDWDEVEKFLVKIGKLPAKEATI